MRAGLDLQALVDSLGEQARTTRSDYHLTLGDLIAAIALHRGALTAIVFDRGGAPSAPHSYRGYYADLAFEASGDWRLDPAVDEIDGCLGRTFEGYKGGDFTMGEDAPLWLSGYGEASRIAIAGCDFSDGTLTLRTLRLD